MRGIDDDTVGRAASASSLTLGGILRHLTPAERVWTHIMVRGDGSTPDGMWDMEQYERPKGTTAAELIEAHRSATAATDAAVSEQSDLARRVRLPEVPWAPDEVQHMTVRGVLIRLLRETAHHSGHADIVRESIDGATTTAQLG